MEKYIIKLSKIAQKDKIKIKNAGLENITRNILNNLSIDPFYYPPSFEKLSGDLNNKYSRRINRQHRIVYRVDKEKNEIYIYRMWTHYEK